MHAFKIRRTAGCCLSLAVSWMALCAFPATAANLALNKTATGSTACNSNEGPAKAFNGSVSGGNSDKFCSSASSRWVYVDLGSTRSVSHFVVKHAGAGGEPTAFNTKDFSISTWDGSQWVNAVTVTNNTASTTSHSISARNTRYARLDIQAPTQTTDAAARIYEFEVHDTSPTPENVVQVFDQIPQFGIYRSTEPNYTPPAGVLMWKRGTEYARKLSSAEKQLIGSDVALRITYHAQCDEYDRFASTFFISMPAGQAPTESTPRVTFTDFISPFSNAWQGQYATRVYPDASAAPYAAALSNPDRDIWIGLSGGSNPQYGSDACEQRGITDPEIAEVGFKYSLALVSRQAIGTVGDRDVIGLLSRSEERDDEITMASASPNAQLDLATLAVSIAGYGPDSGGQEYAKSDITIYRNGVSIASFNTGVECSSYAVYSPRGNPGIFKNNQTTNPRSWCPGALIQMRYYNLGQVNGTAQNISLEVGNPSPWTGESLYRTSVSILEH